MWPSVIGQCYLYMCTHCSVDQIFYTTLVAGSGLAFTSGVVVCLSVW